MKNLAPRFTVGLSTFLALAAFACSSSAPDPIGSGSKNDDPPSSAKKTDDKSAKTDTDTTTPAPSTPLSDTSECGKKATAEACGDCCIAKNQAAFDAAGEVGYACICAATTCQTACAESICAAADNQNEPTAACKTCLDANDQTCNDKATAACDANADCKAIDSCLMTSCEPLAQKEGAGNPTPKVLSVRAAARAIRRQ
jgi:hypothetical protein